MTKEAVIAWWDDPVADDFRRIMNQHIKDSFVNIRLALGDGNLNQALAWNTRLDVCEEMLELRDEMVKEAGENENN